MPLEGIRVVDLTVMVQGPVASMMLGDLGAEVIKIEDRIHGDLMRGMKSILDQSLELPGGRNMHFECCNRSKKGIALDLSKPAGKEVVYRLVERSDVFVQNLAPGVADKLGLSYETLRQHNPKLIYASASTNGPKGPDAGKRGLDPTIAARSGFIDAISPPDSFNYAISICDQMSGVMLAYAIMTALTARERFGVGQRVDASAFASMAWLLQMRVQSPLLLGTKVPKYNREKMSNPLTNYYRTADGKWIAICLYQPDRFWGECCRALDIEDLEDDPRFDSMASRSMNREELIAIFDRVFATKTRAEWLAIFREYPEWIYEPVQSFDEIVSDPQMLANDYLVDVDHPILGPVKMLGVPFTLSETPGAITSVAPEFGQHTEEVLLDVGGYSWDEIVTLREQEVI